MPPLLCRPLLFDVAQEIIAERSGNNPKDWEQALYAFLAEKHKKSESRRTVEGYSRMLQDFFGNCLDQHSMPCGSIAGVRTRSGHNARRSTPYGHRSPNRARE